MGRTYSAPPQTAVSGAVAVNAAVARKIAA
jgi:hypothetical protein